MPQSHGTPPRRTPGADRGRRSHRVRRERLDLITSDEVRAEGFPDSTPAEFVAFFCRTHTGCTPESVVTRIQWRYLDNPI
ncbi:hypothetical protein ACTD5D_31400 [Nocardia takedensis]|uniref:hypothetical protein n=1 Tax=Nocardia takedensis TaxID=259390 RepID=UPI003F75DD4A